MIYSIAHWLHWQLGTNIHYDILNGSVLHVGVTLSMFNMLSFINCHCSIVAALVCTIYQIGRFFILILLCPSHFSLISRTRVSKVPMNRKYLSADKKFTMSLTCFIMSVENAVLTNIVNTVGGTNIVCDVWQIDCHVNDMAGCEDMWADDAT